VNKPLVQLKVGEWWYLPQLDRLVQLDDQGNIRRQLDLDNLCQSVLNYFLLNPDRLISKEELLQQVWNLTSVSDGRIARVISILRDGLCDDVKAPNYIETINKRGYRFIAPVEQAQLPTEEPLETQPEVPKKLNWFIVALGAVVFIAAMLWWWQSTSAIPNKSLQFGRWAPVSSMDGFEYYPAISRDGRYLVYSNAKTGEENNVLILQDLQSQQKITLTKNTTDNFGATFSPDGKQVAYQSLSYRKSCEIRVLTLTAELLPQHDEKLTDCGKKSVSARLSWAPDGSSVLYASATDDENRMAIYQYDFLSRTSRQLILPSPIGFGDFVARFSNHGDKVAFLRDIASDSVQLWLMDLPSQQTQLIAKLDKSYPGDFAWSADDSRIYFPSNNKTIEQLTIADKRQQTAIVTDNRIYELLLSPNNEFFASIGRYGSYSITRYNNSVKNPVASKEEIFKSNQNENLIESSSIDGGPIAAVSKRTGSPQIWLAFPDGRQQQLSHFSTEVQISELKFSRRGSELAAVVDQRLWLFPLQGEAKPLAEPGLIIKNISAGPEPDSFYYSVNKNGRWSTMKYSVLSAERVQVEAGIDLYLQTRDSKVLLKRIADTSQYRLSIDGEPVELSDAFLQRMIYEPQLELTGGGIYFSDVDEKKNSRVFYYSFENQSIIETSARSDLYSYRFSVSPDEQFIYMVTLETRDIDIAILKLSSTN